MNKIIITTSWDDGHKLDIKLSKLLSKYQIKGTFYISPFNREIKKDLLLTNSEVINLSRNFEIGAHTMTHPLLDQVSVEEAKNEIENSKSYLEKLINQEVPMFSYPRGLFNQKVKDIVKNAGFLGARTIRRFSHSMPFDYYEWGTTVHAFTHRINFSKQLPITCNIKLIPTLLTKDWMKVSRVTFDYVYSHGGIWHLWGHSWELEQNNSWQKFEDILRYISMKDGVLYANNGEVIKQFKHI